MQNVVENSNELGSAVHKSNEREVGVELVRIVATILIISFHAFHGVIQEDWEVDFNANSVVNVLFMQGGAVANYLFVIVSSWFLCEKNIFHSIKIISIVVKTWVISVLIYVVTYQLGLLPNMNQELYKAVFIPILSKSYGFLFYYICYYLMVPFIREGIARISEERLRKLCEYSGFRVPAVRC